MGVLPPVLPLSAWLGSVWVVFFSGLFNKFKKMREFRFSLGMESLLPILFGEFFPK